MTSEGDIYICPNGYRDCNGECGCMDDDEEYQRKPGVVRQLTRDEVAALIVHGKISAALDDVFGFAYETVADGERYRDGNLEHGHGTYGPIGWRGMIVSLVIVTAAVAEMTGDR